MSAGAAGGGAGAVVRQGHLRKLKTMKKKYFVLRAETQECSARLEYYESEKKFRAGAAPRRVLPLKSCYNITRRLDLKQKHVIALFTREEQFCIVAENEQDLHAWLTAILKQHRSDDASEELLHPIQHVWQVNVQKKGLGSSKNIQGLYNLCLTDKTLTLVKIKSHNNVISDLGIPERIEYSLKSIRRCGDSECFFYMEVGRQTSTGAGELWMHSDDSNIAQSMHSTIYLAMRNCAKETENERDHIILPKPSLDPPSHLTARRSTFSETRKSAFANEKACGLCVGSCIKQCVCASGTHSLDGSAAAPALAPVAPFVTHAENQPPNNSLTSDNPERVRVIKHHRTVSLPTGCSLFQEPLKVAHERTRSAPLTGDEVDRVTIERSAAHSSCKAVNGMEKKAPAHWSRRGSTGARLSKLSPAHSKNAGPQLRTRCETMPSRASANLFEVERPPPRHTDLEGVDVSRDEPDSLAEWYRTPRIPEEPDCCDVTRDFISSGGRVGGPVSGVGAGAGAGSVHHSRSSSMGTEDAVPDGYLPMAPGHDPLPALVSASSGSVCSGTPSTDPRFSEYNLDPATSHIVEGCRPPRAWSVGSRAALPARPEPRHRAYSVGAHCRPAPTSASASAAHPRAPTSAPLLPRASAEDLMELDFSANSPQPKVIVARTPPAAGFMEPPQSRANTDEYVDMSPRNAGPLPAPTPPAAPAPAPVPDGYVEMNYTRAPTRPIAITSHPPVPPAPVAPPTGSSPPRRAQLRDARTPLGSQTIFPLSLDSPASPPELDASDCFEDDAKDEPPTHLTTVRELSEDGRRSPEASSGSGLTSGGASGSGSGNGAEALASSPQYVRLCRAPAAKPLAANPTANKTFVRPPDAPNRVDAKATVVVAGSGSAAARFSVSASPPSTPPPAVDGGGGSPLNYAALDLQPRRPPPPAAPRTYTQIDFVRSEKLHAADGT